MSWFSTVSNAPLVEIQEWERRGLTDTAADTYLTALADSGYSGTKTPIGGGGYNVRYASATIGTWDT
jgi:hypothetical protein